MDSLFEYPLFTNTELELFNGKSAPEILVRVERELGMDAVWKLTRYRGGTSIYLPRPSFNGSKLEGPLEAKLVTTLSTLYGYGDLLIPMGSFAHEPARAAAIRHLVDTEGLSRAQVARRVHCHTRTVTRICLQMENCGLLSSL